MTVKNIRQLLENDGRYTFEAYQFVREALAYAHDALGLGTAVQADEDEDDASGERNPAEQHLTGQQLCEAIRQYALEQYGYMARVVLKSWGITCTSDFGEIVYNLIAIRLMKKSSHDRREDFDDVYDFDEAFCKDFRIAPPSIY